jgi:hypothetical protein
VRYTGTQSVCMYVQYKQAPLASRLLCALPRYVFCSRRRVGGERQGVVDENNVSLISLRDPKKGRREGGGGVCGRYYGEEGPNHAAVWHKAVTGACAQSRKKRRIVN